MSEAPGVPGSLHDKNGGQGIKVGEPEVEKPYPIPETAFLAIDVGSKEPFTARRSSASSPLLKTFPNTPAERRKLLVSVRHRKDPERLIRVCPETKGGYSLEISLLLVVQNLKGG